MIEEVNCFCFLNIEQKVKEIAEIMINNKIEKIKNGRKNKM